jgi:hypothetical protein
VTDATLFRYSGHLGVFANIAVAAIFAAGLNG